MLHLRKLLKYVVSLNQYRENISNFNFFKMYLNLSNEVYQITMEMYSLYGRETKPVKGKFLNIISPLTFTRDLLFKR